jgi:DNA polymerase-3 subunit epsilon
LQNGDNYFGSWFWSNTLDVMVLATAFLATRRPDMENFKLSTVAKTLGIEVKDDSLHNAMYDIDLTKAIFNIVTNGKR